MLTLVRKCFSVRTLDIPLPRFGCSFLVAMLLRYASAKDCGERVLLSEKDPDTILFRSNPKTQSEAVRSVLTAFTRSWFNGTGKVRLERHTARFTKGLPLEALGYCQNGNSLW